MRPAPADARRYLVNDQVDSVFSTQALERSQVVITEDVAALADDRFDEDGGYPVGSEVRDLALKTARLLVAARRLEGPTGMPDAGYQRTAGFVEVRQPGERARPRAEAVEAMPQGEHGLPLG